MGTQILRGGKWALPGGFISELLAPFRERYFISGEINSTVDDVPVRLQTLKDAYGSKAKPGVASGRRLVRVRRLALQRAAVQHRAAAAAEPGSTVGVQDGVAPGRGARADPLVTVTDRRPPFRFSFVTRVGFDETDAQGVVYYGRYMPYFDRARVEYLRHLDLLTTARALTEFVMRAQHVEYHAPAKFDDQLEVFVRVAEDRGDQRALAVRSRRRDHRRPPGDRRSDGCPDRSRRAGVHVPVGEHLRTIVRAFDTDVEL